MLRAGVLHPELAKLFASLGHGDLLIISDAGFPVPRDAWRVDLAITRDLPSVVDVLRVVNDHLISEEIMFAEELATNNPVLLRTLQEIFVEPIHRTVRHADIVGDMAHRAKGIVRTGGYEPWGNIVVQCGTDPFAWFERPGTVVSPFYEERQSYVKSARGEGVVSDA